MTSFEAQTKRVYWYLVDSMSVNCFRFSNTEELQISPFEYLMGETVCLPCITGVVSWNLVSSLHFKGRGLWQLWQFLSGDIHRAEVTNRFLTIIHVNKIYCCSALLLDFSNERYSFPSSLSVVKHSINVLIFHLLFHHRRSLLDFHLSSLVHSCVVKASHLCIWKKINYFVVLIFHLFIFEVIDMTNG